MLRNHLIELRNRRQIHKRIPLYKQLIILQKLRLLLLGKCDSKLKKAALKSFKIVFFHVVLRSTLFFQVPAALFVPVHAVSKHLLFRCIRM